MSQVLRVFVSPQMEADFHRAYDAVLQKWPVPCAESWIETRFGKTHVIASGPKEGIPLMLLHPGGGNATIWHRSIAGLSQRHQTFAVDIIGEMNKSVPIRRIRTRQDLSDWMSDLLDGLQVDSTCLVGNSNGGFFAMIAAILLPQRVSKLVLISPAATFSCMLRWWWHLFVPAHVVAPLIGSEEMVLASHRWLWNGFPMEEDYSRLQRLSKVGGYPRFRPTRNSLRPKRLARRDLRQVRMPVLLLIGEREVIYSPRRVMRRASRLVAGLRAEGVPKANHCAQYTAPDETVRRILEFLDR